MLKQWCVVTFTEITSRDLHLLYCFFHKGRPLPALRYTLWFFFQGLNFTDQKRRQEIEHRNATAKDLNSTAKCMGTCSISEHTE